MTFAQKIFGGRNFQKNQRFLKIYFRTDHVVMALTQVSHAETMQYAIQLKTISLYGIATNQQLHIIACYCTNEKCKI